ncbi:transcriptional regulator [Halobacteria archaeon AArc-curdl1]|uniref:Transcriptional regulator n=1 Tax=Natronosalvus hydrolyticus TaxID=2979988 RepID=A0AAP2Z839_9EURY|nr:transcriptional regulator [Halobacteria archaeon AArc-curdl1]
MADLNAIAKRIHNISPDPVFLRLEDGTEAVFRMDWVEFFQQEFKAEGVCDDDDADYRFVSSADNESVLVGRQGPAESGWTAVGAVEEAKRVTDDASADS